MSNNSIRMIEVYKTATPDQKLTIKGLEVKEDVIVVSHIVASDSWRTEVLNEPEKDLAIKLVFPFAKDNTVSSQNIVDYFTLKGITGLTFKNATTGKNLLKPESVAVSPESATIAAGTTQQFTATSTPAESEQSVIWSIGATEEDVTIGASGLVTVASGVTPGDFIVIATSTENGEIFGTSVLTVTAE